MPNWATGISNWATGISSQPIIFLQSHFSIIMMLLKFILISFFSGCLSIKICENGLFCASDEDCQIGNHCKEFGDEKFKLTRCVPREDLDDTYYCSLSKKSCECE